MIPLKQRQLQMTMVASSCIGGIRGRGGGPIIVFLAAFFVLLLVSIPSSAAPAGVCCGGGNGTLVTFRSTKELFALQRIEAQLARVRNASIKTIQSPDGDVIDCVPMHLQPAFEHPKLRGQKPQSEPAERPWVPAVHGHGDAGAAASAEDDGEEQGLPQQTWTRSGESCPEGTIPMRRTTEDDVFRASSIRRFGMKERGSGAFAQPDYNGADRHKHEHAIGYVSGGSFYGARATLNVWTPRVASPVEFSLAQIWVVSSTSGNDFNTIEAGWQVSPQIYGDYRPRFFIYWTNDAYQKTGCYNLRCPGFVQTSNRIAIGAAFSRTSSYQGRQVDVNILIWKDPKQGHWWLKLGGTVVGYWPSPLFTRLASGAGQVHFGGEVAAAPRAPGAPHTRTQMGSGRFAREGYSRAAYVRNPQVVARDNSLVPATGLRFFAGRPGCYDISGGAWDTAFYYGGPGKNIRCPYY